MSSTVPLAIPSAAPTPAADAARARAVSWRVAVGVGCRAGRPAEAIEAAIEAALTRRPGLTRAAIALVATLDAKAAEPGLVACCVHNGWPLVAITRETIAARAFVADGRGTGGEPTTGEPPASAVQARFGIDGVCEPCARAAAPAGTLLVPKTIVDGVTVAIAGPL